MHLPRPIRHRHQSLLIPGKTCWRAEQARRATLLIDGEEYFAALRAAMLEARRQILIAGWDFDTRITLPRSPGESTGTEDAAPEELAAFLEYLLKRRPELEIHVARWDYHWFYVDDRETSTRSRLEAIGVRFLHDSSHPEPTGCIHHKIVTIDGVLAFCGGIDITHKRWDTCAHLPDDPRRTTSSGDPYIAVHDTQMCVDGPVASALTDYVIETWPGPRPERVVGQADIWPRHLAVEFRDVTIGIARTWPPTATAEEIREIEAFYLAAIGRTERAFYAENQYFTSTKIAGAIAERFRQRRHLDGLLVGLDRPQTASELHTMGYGRSEFCKVLHEAHVADRVPLVAAFSGRIGINVHSKFATFDDRWLTVGSANLNRRSMGFDVECNLIIEASTPAHRAQIERARNRLLGEHLGLSENEVIAALATHGLSGLPEACSNERRLVRLDPLEVESSLGPLLVPIFDPEDPRASPPPVERLRRWYIALALVGVALIVTAALTGRLLHDELSSYSSVQEFLESFLPT